MPGPNFLPFVERIRQQELETVASLIPKSGRVLEIGAGAGWQARDLAARGYDVRAVDVDGSYYERVRVFPVDVYDGRHLPFDDREFDVVFSSNVLEYVDQIHEFQRELARVLAPGGAIVHVVPSPTWRFWTSLAHYPAMVHLLLRRPESQPTENGGVPETRPDRRKRLLRKLVRAAVPHRDGIRGSALTEAYYFSRLYWLPAFRRAGFVVESVRPNRLFYTGHKLLGPRLNLSVRRKLSYLLGSSCVIYCLRAPERVAK